MPINHGRRASNATLNPNAPTAPAMPSGRQHASEARALSAAAIGVTRSVTLTTLPPGSQLESPHPVELLSAGLHRCKCDTQIQMPGMFWRRARRPARRYGSSVNRGTPLVEPLPNPSPQSQPTPRIQSLAAVLPIRVLRLEGGSGTLPDTTFLFSYLFS